jgi:hypothetical protein
MPEYIEISSKKAREIVATKCPTVENEINFERDEYMNEDGECVVRHYKGNTVFHGDFAVEADTVLVAQRNKAALLI